MPSAPAPFQIPPRPPVEPSRLRSCPMLDALDDAALATFAHYVDHVTVPPGSAVVNEGDAPSAMYFVLSGDAQLVRQRVALRPLRPGDMFGEIGLVTRRPRAATVTSTSELELARLARTRYDALLLDHPAVGRMLLQGLVARLGELLVAMTDSMGLLLSERSLPRRTDVEVHLQGESRRVAMGTVVGGLMPAEVDGAPVVAALVDHKAASLASRLVSDARAEPLTTAHWEGREIVRHSAGLLVLEAAAQVAPGVRVALDGTLGGAQALEVSPPPADPAALADAITKRMRALADADVPLREELWTTPEARSWFAEHGWEDAALLLDSSRASRVVLASCGRVYALAPGPLLPSTGALGEARVVAGPAGLRLEFGEAMRRHLPNRDGEETGPVPDDSEMSRAHKAWLRAMGVASVGAFNERCVTGKVADIIRVSEGFHEKRIGAIADRIAAQRPRPRVICIAGPSSSGKTTFIRRLTVQLQVNGMNPVSLSLDDYYVDREKTPRDERGEYDFEAFEAIDSRLLRSQVARALAGEAVRTAHYDFKTGKSAQEGGPEVRLGPNDVLMLEGIHGLNPELLGGDVDPADVFRIFIHPSTALPLDRLSPVSTSDLRLVRRIVRDRHGRNYKAADTIKRWPSVRRGERTHILPFLPNADTVFDSSLPYELSVLKVYAERYLLEVPLDHPASVTAFRLRHLLDQFVSIYPDHVPPTSILREFIGGSGFEY